MALEVELAGTSSVLYQHHLQHRSRFRYKTRGNSQTAAVAENSWLVVEVVHTVQAALRIVLEDSGQEVGAREEDTVREQDQIVREVERTDECSEVGVGT